MNNNTTTKMVSLKPQFVMSQEDINYLESLPDNLPDTTLTRTQQNKIFDLYNKYISKNQVYKGWGIELYAVEQKEKWPTGPRVKLHEAQRMILGWLLLENKYRASMDYKKAADYFLATLKSRESNQILVSQIFDIK